MNYRHYLYAVCLLACMPAAAEIFKCTDPQGAVHYTDKPCTGESTVFTPRAAPKADADSEQRMDKTRRLLRAYSEEQAEEEQAAAKQQLEQQQRESKCASARSRLDQYLHASRIYRIDQDGKQVNLSAEERTQTTEQARAEVELWCD